MEIRRKPAVDGLCDESCLELCKYPVPLIIVVNCLQRIGRKPITYNNAFPVSKRAFLLQIKLKYVEDIIVTRDTANIGMSRKEVVQAISGMVQAILYFRS